VFAKDASPRTVEQSSTLRPEVGPWIEKIAGSVIAYGEHAEF
jgi:hypothetical protein